MAAISRFWEAFSTSPPRGGHSRARPNHPWDKGHYDVSNIPTKAPSKLRRKTETLFKPPEEFVNAGLAFYEGVNEVNRLATKGEKISLTTDKTRKKLPTSDKKIN